MPVLFMAPKVGNRTRLCFLNKLSIVQYRLAGTPRSCITFLQRCSLVSEKLFYAFDHLRRLIHNSFSQRLKFLA